MLTNILAVSVIAAALLYRFGRPWLAKRRTKDAGDWPETEATIQSAKMEMVERVGHLRERLPFFEFSHVVDGEYYSGRFGVRVAEDRATALLKEWLGTRITVRYDPERPSIFSVPDTMSVDGFRVDTVRECDLASRH